MTTKHREKDIEHFDQWASTYENSWLQRAFFDRAHQATLTLAAGIVHQPVSVLNAAAEQENCCVQPLPIGRRRN